MKKVNKYRYKGAVDVGWFTSLASETDGENIVAIEVREILGVTEGVETLGNTENIYASVREIRNRKRHDGILTISGIIYGNRRKFVFRFFRNTSEGILRIQP